MLFLINAYYGNQSTEIWILVWFWVWGICTLVLILMLFVAADRSMMSGLDRSMRLQRSRGWCENWFKVVVWVTDGGFPQSFKLFFCRELKGCRGKQLRASVSTFHVSLLAQNFSLPRKSRYLRQLAQPFLLDCSWLLLQAPPVCYLTL